MYKYPQSKRYKYTIPTKRWDCVLTFNQSTAKQTSEYLEILELLLWNDTSKQIEWILLQRDYIDKFFVNNYQYKRYNIKKRQVLLLVKNDIDTYISDIVWMLHPLRKSMYTDTKSPSIWWKKPKPYPFDNHLEVLVKKTGISIDELYERLTMEQIGWYMDKVVYDNYETFKEGKAINTKVMAQWWLTAEQNKDLDIIKKYFTNNK